MSSRKVWTDREDIRPKGTPTDILSVATVAEILTENFDMTNMSRAQQNYVSANLLSASSAALPVLEESLRAGGAKEARIPSPAHSLARTAPHEAALYELIMKGDAEGVRNVTEKQKNTFTTHPNFSRSRDLAGKTRELIATLSDMTGEEVKKMFATRKPPEGMQDILNDMKPMIVPRKKRTRRDELEEATLDLIPAVMEAPIRTMNIIKRRYKAVTGKEMEFTSTAQLDALAELMPKYHTWFPDGDGKRTSHVYDAEMMIPAIKEGTFEEYGRLLDRMGKKGIGENGSEFKAEDWNRRLQSRSAVLGEVKALAATRMDTFNEAHAVHGELMKTPGNEALQERMEEVQGAADVASKNYKYKLNSEWKAGAKTRIYELLKRDTAGDMLASLKPALDHALKQRKEARLHPGAALEPDPASLAVAQELYLSLKVSGDYAVLPQRRENAAQYREVFEYLVGREDSPLKSVIQKALPETLVCPEEEIVARFREPVFYTAAVEAVAKSAMDPSDPATRDYMQKVYRKLAHKLETPLGGDRLSDRVAMQALQPNELLTLDALGYFHMGKLYTEAFSAGFVTAEFAQPKDKLLRAKGPEAEEAIRKEVIRLAKDDYHLQIAIANGMGMPEASIIPLCEDPATIKYIHEAISGLREGLALEYLLKQTGATTPEAARAKAVRYMDGKGETQPLNAWQHLQRFGVSEDELKSHGLDTAMLKNTHVLRGPDDMKACSDIGKRADIIGSELVEQSIRKENMTAALYPVKIGDQNYIIVNPKYLGQGGSIMRATGVPPDAVQETLQGEHLNNQTAASFATNGLLKTLSRFYMRQQAAQGEEPPAVTEGFRKALKEVVGDMPFHTGNTLGLRGYKATDEEVALMFGEINERIRSTRDDPRYDAFLTKYGDSTPNYSARPENKDGSLMKSFKTGRAIGIAGDEQGIYPNVIGFAKLFEFSARTGEVMPESVVKLKQWVEKDSYMQHIMMAVAHTAYMAYPEEKWKMGGITYHEDDKAGVTLEKEGVSVSLAKLTAAYHDKAGELKAGNVTFDAADLVMAYETDQLQKLKKGLLAFYEKDKLLDLFPAAHRDTVVAYKVLSDEVLRMKHDKTLNADDKKLIDGIYYVMQESGPIYQGLEPLQKDILARYAEPGKAAAVGL